MTTYLLDANVLIALVVEEHDHHQRVTRWATRPERFAISPIAEGALIRYLIRIGEQLASARAALAATRTSPRIEFWPDAISYADVDLAHVRGHAQVTDAYLAGLASSRGGLLATLDEALAKQCPQSTLLVPA